MGPIGGILQLMDGLLPVLDVDHLCHISGGKKSLNEELRGTQNDEALHLSGHLQSIKISNLAFESCTYLTLRTVKEPSFIPSAR